MNNPKIMQQIYLMKEIHYEVTKHLSIQEQIMEIQIESENIRKRLLEKINENKISITISNQAEFGIHS